MLRQQLQLLTKSHAAAKSPAASAYLCERMKVQPVWQQACAVLLFFPLADEPDITPLISTALAAGKTVCFLRHLPGQNDYEARVVADVSRDLERGAFGVREPVSRCPVWPLNRLDLTLVPGVGFTLDGWRLGRGQGFYDRLLARVSGVKCGVAFDWQIVPEMPVEPHDVRLDCILTPSRWLAVPGSRTV
ncbi:MAG: 5-formyltetrahydrofolate cyclo-ligase [Verrucomicrobia bacterium]|nr:5-formyltetrahydrofolate cyclo-ligase [Verrucomicrobiota bacterium]